MRKGTLILAVLFFSSLWGISEATLGDVLYRANAAYASVPLCAIGFVVLTFAWVCFPRAGIGTLVAGCAMLYKFLNAPFFACHLLGIVAMGVCYDLFFGVLRVKRRWLGAVGATYLSYIFFALMITYVFRYEHWVEGGLVKVLHHIGISGSLAALGSGFLVPLSFRAGERLKSSAITSLEFGRRWTSRAVSVITLGLWVFGVTAYLANHLPAR